MTRRLVYASGPISATDYEGATDWYRELDRQLSDNIRLVRPMRWKGFLKGAGTIGHGEQLTTEQGRLLATGASITGRDRYDTQRCDAVIMNLTPCEGRVSIGCMIEAGWADAARVPIVLCMEPGNIHEGHLILEHLAAFRVTNLEDAAYCLNALFGDDL